MSSISVTLNTEFNVTLYYSFPSFPLEIVHAEWLFSTDYSYFWSSESLGGSFHEVFWNKFKSSKAKSLCVLSPDIVSVSCAKQYFPLLPYLETCLPLRIWGSSLGPTASESRPCPEPTTPVRKVGLSPRKLIIITCYRILAISCSILDSFFKKMLTVIKVYVHLTHDLFLRIINTVVVLVTKWCLTLWDPHGL